MATVVDAVVGKPVEAQPEHIQVEEHEESRCSPFCYAKPAVERPCSTCASFCGCLLFFIVLVGALLAGGVEVIRFTNEVPFYLYDSTVYKEQTALQSAFDVANARLGGALVEREEAESDFQLKIIYVLDGGETLFTAEILEGIRELEKKIVAVEEYTEFCAYNYDFDSENPICARQTSAVNFFAPEWWNRSVPFPTLASEENYEIGFETILAGSSADKYYAFADPEDADMDVIDLSEGNIDDVVEYWAGYCSDGSSSACPEAANRDESPYAMIVNQTYVNLSNQLVSIADTDWSIQGDAVETNAVALLSVFYFGAPQRKDDGELYTMETEDFEEQRENLGKFLFDNLEDILEDGVDGVTVFWDGSTNGMENEWSNAVLSEDSNLLIPSIFFIILYLMLQLRSWWLGGVGILMILGNFGPALILYRLLSGYSYFGTLNALSVFLVLGIGADDIFVFANTWKDVRREESHLSVVNQLKHALSVGGKAMLVTSVTTAVSFLMNAVSGFPAVQSFGIFSAILVVVNFCMVITLFPAGYMVYEYYFYDPEVKKGIVRDTFRCCKKEKGIPQRLPAVHGVEDGDTLVRFFRDRFHPFIHRFNKLVLVIFIAIFAMYIIVGSGLEPDTEEPQVLPDSDQYVEVAEKIQKFFSHSDISGLITVEIPFGVVGVDRDDCNGDPCDPTILTDYGAPIWDDDIDYISNEYTQRWFLDFCDAIGEDSDDTENLYVYEADDSVSLPIMCPLQYFKIWCGQNEGACQQTHGTLDDEDYIVDSDMFEETLLNFLNETIPTTSADVFSSSTTNYDVWEDQIRAQLREDIDDDDYDGDSTYKLRYISVEVLLSERFDIEFSTGIDLYNDWGDFLDKWIYLAQTDSTYQDPEETSDLSVYGLVDSAYVTDSGVFHWFFLQEAIIQEAFQGIGLSLLAAFIILCIATSNWVVSFLAILTIAAMVGGVVFFTVINGWKLGVLEAILFVMVVGFSVDYTIHLSDAFLESEKASTTDRTRDMLARMGPSVLSGAISTIGACFPLLFAYFVFFFKFGFVIFFIILQSLVFSLFMYSALLDMFGPQQPIWGKNVRKNAHVAIKHPEVGDHVFGKEHKDDPEHLQYGKVVSVEGDSVTVALEHDAGETVVVMESVRKRYEFGHLLLVQTCVESVNDFVHRRFGNSQAGAKAGGRDQGEE